MSVYQFRYSDGTGFTITNTFAFENDEEALSVAALTFERFGVEVIRHGQPIGRFPPNMTIGLHPRDDIVMT